MIRRRTCMLGAFTVLVASRPAIAGPERADIRERRLQNRLELWESYASRTENLIARYTTTRHSSLLHQSLVATGTLAFAAPDRLTLEDDGGSGSTTRIQGTRISVQPNQSTLPRGPEIDGVALPAADWLRVRWLKMFAPGTGKELVAGCRIHMPKRRGYVLELLPQRGSLVRKVLRGVSLRLDPVGGAVIEIEIMEAQGDRVHMALADHRQNVPIEELEPLLG